MPSVLEIINTLKVELKMLVNSKGLNHTKTIECSQRLDKYLLIYQQANLTNTKKETWQNSGQNPSPRSVTH